MKPAKLIPIEFKGVLIRRIIGLLGVLVIIMISGCSNPGSELIGAWSEYSQYEYGKERCEFFKDGTCYFEVSDGRIAGRWSALEDGRIKVEVTKGELFGGASVMTLFAAVTADELILDVGGNKRATYVREGSQRATEIQSAIKKVVEEREIRIEAEKRAQAEKLEAERVAREKQREAERIARANRQEAKRAARAKRQKAERAARAKKQEAERAFRVGYEAFKRGLYAQGVAECERSWKLGNVAALNALAWHFAACKDPKQHDGKRAVELALKLTKLKPEKRELDTLAAAYARNGQFKEAVNTQVRALSLGRISGGEERLKLYRQDRPYREYSQAEKREAKRLSREKQQKAKRAAKTGKKAFKRGLYAQGVAEYERSWKLGNMAALNSLAWHFAACKDPRQHDGNRAVELALKLTKLKAGKNELDTLAAAYARNGQFKEAVNTQVRALSLGSIPGGEARLKLYRQGRPYQEH